MAATRGGLVVNTAGLGSARQHSYTRSVVCIFRGVRYAHAQCVSSCMKAADSIYAKIPDHYQDLKNIFTACLLVKSHGSEEKEDMGFDRIPIFKRLEHSRRIVLAGAGGGFDIFCGLPLYFLLREQGKEVQLVNLSFTDFRGITGRKVTTATIEVTAESSGPDDYFPEKYLCRWFKTQGEDISIMCISPNGVVPLRAAYRVILHEFDADTVILIDGGTDSLMRGDEAGLGTPNEDMASVAAVEALSEVEQKFLVCVGFGVDAYHGVCHAQVLGAIASLSKSGGFLGCLSLHPEEHEVQLYKEATEFVIDAMPNRPSIVNASILSSIDGEYGDYHRTHKTVGNKLWINPLMSILWAFELQDVARRCLYLDRIRRTHTLQEINETIQAFRRENVSQEWDKIPI